MKNKISILMILAIVFLPSGLGLKVLAQEATRSASSPALERSIKSNRSCVKVGTVSDEDKPAICNQPATTDGTPGDVKIANDGKHACPITTAYTPYVSYSAIKATEFSYVCGHNRPIFNAIDIGTFPGGGTPVVAVVDGRVDNISNPVGGPALWIVGDDGQNYYYAHLRREGLVTGRVTVGQIIGYIAAASENSFAKNNGVAHVHISTGTPGNQQTFGDPANIPMGPLLDVWCEIDVCKGKPNAAY